LGGSGASREISSAIVETEGFSDELLAITYEGRDKSILLDRLDWARSYCKLGGVLESPKRGLFLLTDSGRAIVALAADEAKAQLLEVDRSVRRARYKKKDADDDADDTEPSSDVEDDDSWREALLGRLHSLSPDGFERFSMYLLRSQGMELKRTGGSGDEGVDGIGTAPLTGVLTTTVAVQAKRYEPSKTIGREAVALFQSDASAKGAEYGVLVTTARFSGPARQAALGRKPTIVLIDGEKLADLCLQAEIGIRLSPVAEDESFFDRFESDSRIS
jgi:restriction system protein